MPFGPVVSVDELRAMLEDVVVIDIRWSLLEPEYGRTSYLAGHTPGAVFVELDDVTGDVGEGRHPIPTREGFERAMRAAGVCRGSRVVVYDDAAASIASRLWWLLRAFGHEDAAVLDGGVQAWGDDLEPGNVMVAVGDFVAAEPDLSQIVLADDIAGLDGAVLIDVRAPERFRGETEPVDPVAGHVPGARNAFFAEAVVEDGHLASPDVVRERFEALGVTDDNAVVYCGSGVVASQTVLQLERAGFRPKLFAGGWSEWSSRAVRGEAPVETGD